MVSGKKALALFFIGPIVTGCAVQQGVDVESLPPTAAGGETIDHVIDNDNVGFYTSGSWNRSTAISGFEGGYYLQSPPGTGQKLATWNINIVRTFDIFAKWTSTGLRGSNVKFVVHHLDADNKLVTDTVTVNQRQNSGTWVKLGTYRMSILTGRVTVSDDADGYVVADAVLFREVLAAGQAPEPEPEPAPEPVTDADGDGILDEWELRNGLDPNNPDDAYADADGDGLTNLDEFLALTNPASTDSDGDSIPDGFEVQYGLDPNLSDGTVDNDGDGLTNYQEFLADSDPSDIGSGLEPNSVVLSWQAPTERTDGTALAPSDIAQYELTYQKAASDVQRVIDNTATEFSSYGGGRLSTGYGGFIGSNYFLMNPGSGEAIAQWQIYNLTPGAQYELLGHWVSSGLRASDATYRYTYVNASGQQVTEQAVVNQRENGGSWQPLATFTTSDTSLLVEIDNDANGYVVADAIRLDQAGSEPQTVTLKPSAYNTHIIEGLEPGTWEFQIRAIDNNGIAGDYSELKTWTVE